MFFYAGLQAIPHSLIEAAAIDGTGPVRRLFGIALPLLSPTSFFLLVVNLVYAFFFFFFFFFFDTFPVIDTATGGGPAQSTKTLIYKIFAENFQGFDIGSSGAQSVVLMMIVIVLTVIQFRFVEHRVQYSRSKTGAASMNSHEVFSVPLSLITSTHSFENIAHIWTYGSGNAAASFGLMLLFSIV